MSTPDDQHLHQVEIDAELELHMVQSSHTEELFGSPQSEWLFDAVDIEREEIGLRSLLGAVQALRRDEVTPDDDGNCRPAPGGSRPQSTNDR